MPIDISIEKPISLLEATTHVPRRRRGRKTAVSTLYRWSNVGVRGIRLETLQVGGTRCTSVESLQRFFDRLSVSTSNESIQPTSMCSTQRRLDHVDRQLDEFWKPGHHNV